MKYWNLNRNVLINNDNELVCCSYLKNNGWIPKMNCHKNKIMDEEKKISGWKEKFSW